MVEQNSPPANVRAPRDSNVSAAATCPARVRAQRDAAGRWGTPRVLGEQCVEGASARGPGAVEPFPVGGQAEGEVLSIACQNVASLGQGPRPGCLSCSISRRRLLTVLRKLLATASRSAAHRGRPKPASVGLVIVEPRSASAINSCRGSQSSSVRILTQPLGEWTEAGQRQWPSVTHPRREFPPGT